MNAKQIIIEHLKSIGADGLCSGGCGCSVANFEENGCSLESDFSECVPAKNIKCTKGQGQHCVDCDHSYEFCEDGENWFVPMEPDGEELDLNDAAEMG